MREAAADVAERELVVCGARECSSVDRHSVQTRPGSREACGTNNWRSVEHVGSGRGSGEPADAAEARCCMRAHATKWQAVVTAETHHGVESSSVVCDPSRTPVSKQKLNAAPRPVRVSSIAAL